MKLSKIYSNKEQFKPITFKDGFNVIYGNVERELDSEGRSHEHNLGKTSLVHLIDFMLLKKIDKGSLFGKHKDKFDGWIFFLEIELNNGKYLTIRRAIDPNTKISFKKHFSKYHSFVYETQWDLEDLSINANKEEDNPTYILQEYLRFDVNNKY